MNRALKYPGLLVRKPRLFANPEFIKPEFVKPEFPTNKFISVNSKFAKHHVLKNDKHSKSSKVQVRKPNKPFQTLKKLKKVHRDVTVSHELKKVDLKTIPDVDLSVTINKYTGTVKVGLPSIRVNSQPSAAYSKLKPLSDKLVQLFKVTRTPDKQSSLLKLWGKHVSAVTMKPLEFKGNLDVMTHPGRISLERRDEFGNLVEMSTNASYYPEKRFRRIQALQKTTHNLSKKQVKLLGKILPEKLKKHQTNLLDRREIPLEYITELPRTPKTELHKYVIKKYTQAFDANRIHNVSSLVRELGMNEEDRKTYKKNERDYGYYLDKVSRGSAHQRYVWDRDMGLAYSFREHIFAWSKQKRVLNEIKVRDPDFQPTRFLDIGCGVGTGYMSVSDIWAPKTSQTIGNEREVPDSFPELKINPEINYFGVDTSRDMIQLAAEMVCTENPMTMTPSEVSNLNARNGIMFSNQFPEKRQKFDVVTMFDVLWDMPSNEDRYKALYKAWRATDKYLVVVDRGGKEGHMLTQLARGFILSQARFVKGSHKILGKNFDFEEGYRVVFTMSKVTKDQ